jgi:ferredoxin-like protein FixX
VFRSSKLDNFKNISLEYVKYLNFIMRIKMRLFRVKTRKEEQKQAFVDCCPTNVFDIDENSKSVYISQPNECIFCIYLVLYIKFNYYLILFNFLIIKLYHIFIFLFLKYNT